MELSLEKVMLTLIGLCFAGMICVPLIYNGMSQAADQYAYSQFQSLTSSIDSGICMVINSTGQRTWQEEMYVPHGVRINSSTEEHRVSYCFNSDLVKTTTHKVYSVAVVIDFNDPAGWYRVKITQENSTLILVSFVHMGTW